MSAKRALTAFRAPDEQQTEEPAWHLVRSAYQERLPAQRRRFYRGVPFAFAGVVLLGAMALSPAGATVGRLITRALGIQHSAPTLSSLPAPGRLLVSGRGGTWTVTADGATQRLGGWTQASWSPHGLYVAAATRDRLAVINPRGRPQWALARQAVDDPRWYPPTGYRIAYLSGGDLRVAAGDGTGDHLLAAGIARLAPAWRPARPYQLAYVSGQGRVIVRDADTGQVLWSAVPHAAVKQLAWSGDGQRLLALSPGVVRIYAANGNLSASVAVPRHESAIDAALSPDGRRLALVLAGSSGEVVVEPLGRRRSEPLRVLAGDGLMQALWSPDGRWLLVSWPAADQWVFVRIVGAPRITALSRIAQQLSDNGTKSAFPQLEGWCCAVGGTAG